MAAGGSWVKGIQGGLSVLCAMSWESRIISVHFQKTSALGSFNRKVLEHNNQDKELPQEERRHTVMPISKSHTHKYKQNMRPSASSQHTPAEILNEKAKCIPP